MKNIRNVAIIAHVDHGKTTLVDKILLACNVFRENQTSGELILDYNELEKERGITIISKNVAVWYHDIKINIIDTPGHADFGGEVERIMNMADGVLLLVDAFEGPMPQTRFVTQKAIEAGKKIILVVNKVDKPNCSPEQTVDAVFDLFFQLGASEEQLNFPVVYGSAKQGWMAEDYRVPSTNIFFLIETIVRHVPCPKEVEGNLQLQISSLDYSSYIGRIGIGKVFRGTLKENMPVSLCKRSGAVVPSRVKEVFVFDGLGKKKVPWVNCGDICAFTGVDGFELGDTLADVEHPEPLPPISVDEPTMSMLFTINNSPFFGKEGKFITSRHLKERLEKETEKNLALRVEPAHSPDAWMVYGRGVLHLSILIETMRREGYELQVGQPRVITKIIDGRKCEPYEILSMDAPEECSGKIIDAVTRRKGELIRMENRNLRVLMEFEIPSRGLIGLRNEILTLSSGQATMAHRFTEYKPWKGEIPTRIPGVLISKEKGVAVAYSIDKLQDRGKFFIAPGEEVYSGMIVGEHTRPDDLVVNVCVEKKLTNMRASGSDEKMKIAPKVKFSLEEVLEYIQEDEWAEITPSCIRMRKIILDENQRKRIQKNNQIQNISEG